MSSDPSPGPTPALETLHHLRSYSTLFLALGIVLIILGGVALSCTVTATFAAVVVFGWLLLLSGIFEAATAFLSLRTGGFLLHLVSGILSIVVGVLFIQHPLNTAAGLTLMLAVGFLVVGLVKLVAALAMRFPHWPLTGLSGVATTAVGGMILASWPNSALWALGMLLGIEILFRGIHWLTLALVLNSLPDSATHPPAA